MILLLSYIVNRRGEIKSNSCLGTENLFFENEKILTSLHLGSQNFFALCATGPKLPATVICKYCKISAFQNKYIVNIALLSFHCDNIFPLAFTLPFYSLYYLNFSLSTLKKSLEIVFKTVIPF